MRIVSKILKIFALLMFLVTVVLITASYLLRDQVGAVVISNINKNIDTKIDVGSFRLSFIRKFPHASLELRDIYVLSSRGFRKDEFGGINTDTLLTAGALSVEFKITDIINKDYDIERIGLKKGRINIFTDSSGRANYAGPDKNKNDSGSLTLNLRRIIISDLNISYKNRATKLEIDGSVNTGKLSSKISNDYIALSAEADLVINHIKQDKISVSVPFNAGLELKMEDSDSGILIRKGALSFEGIRFRITGNITPDNILDLELQGENIDLAKFRKYIPETYSKPLTGYALSGILKFNSTITGMVSGIYNPHIELECSLENGGISNSDTGLNIRDISFNSVITNGMKNNSETGLISIKNLKAKVGSADYSGNLIIRNLLNPVTELDLKGRIFPGELKQMFKIKEITSASGFFDIDLKLKTDFSPEDSITINDIIRLKPEASLKFNSFNIALRKFDHAINNVNGDLDIAQTIKPRKLTLIYKGQKITVSGEFQNLPEWAAGNNVKLKADADIKFDKLDPLTFRSIPPGNEKNGTKRDKAFMMPRDLLLDIRLRIDSLKYESMPVTKFAADLLYRPGLLTFNSFKMNSLDGVISGNGFIAQNNDKALLCKGIFSIADININKTFISFRNFGQDFIKAGNLAGDLTGSLTLLLPLDSLLKPQIKSMVAEGRYIIDKGSLIDFEPVRKLSSFIEISELENIKFEKLENDFFIRNNVIYIPQMDVNSSAADIAVNGKHNFDNTYEYHLKVKLSEILSKKRKKNRTNKTEFGVVEDDGLGRTSLLLKVEGRGDEIKVGYDIKAAGQKVRTSIKSERQTLKSILNQEYGLYKNDTIPEQKPAEKKTRFRISWDESDTINREPEQSEVKKENGLKSLFRKK